MPSSCEVTPRPVEGHTGEFPLPYILPFAVFLVLLAASPWLKFTGIWEYPFRSLILTATLWFVSRQVIDFRVRSWTLTLLTGIAVFLIWIAPDLIFPGYRSHWLFQNAITGSVISSIPDEHRANAMVLFFRTLRAVVLVAIIEELFWRGWLLRWLQSPRFETVPFGHWTGRAMLISAVLFASEHGSYWDVGLIAGLAYNWLAGRTRSLGDCIFAHGLTNACLSAYVILSKRWEYWM